MALTVWKDIAGYEGKYQVSNEGQVKSLARWPRQHDRILKPGTRAKKYKFVVLNAGGKEDHRSVHRLVAEAFLPNPDNLPEVNHKDENPANNNVENLEWCTRAYNIGYSKNRGVVQMRGDSVVAVFKSITEAANLTRIGRRSINNALCGWSGSAGGFKWAYAND